MIIILTSEVRERIKWHLWQQHDEELIHCSMRDVNRHQNYLVVSAPWSGIHAAVYWKTLEGQQRSTIYIHQRKQ